MKFEANKPVNKALLFVEMTLRFGDGFHGLTGDDEIVVHMADELPESEYQAARDTVDAHDADGVTQTQKAEVALWARVHEMRRELLPLVDVEVGELQMTDEQLQALFILLWLRVEALDCKSEQSSS